MKSDRLYYIEKILSVVEEKGQKFLIVKWAHYQNTTKEPLQKFQRENPGFKTEIDILLQEREARKNGFDLKQQIKAQLYNYMIEFYGSNPRRFEGNFQGRQSNVGTAEEKRRAKRLAKQQLIRRHTLGLRDLGAKDYIYFMRLFARVHEMIQVKIRQQSMSVSDSCIDQIIGCYRHQKSFRYAFTMDQQMFTCSQQQAIQDFPIHLARYLQQTTEFMAQHLAQEIKDYDIYGKSSLNNRKAEKNVQQVIAIAQNVNRINSIIFGINSKDLEQRKKQIQSKRKQDLLKNKSDNQDDQTIQELKIFYQNLAIKFAGNAKQLPQIEQQKNISKSSILRGRKRGSSPMSSKKSSRSQKKRGRDRPSKSKNKPDNESESLVSHPLQRQNESGMVRRSSRLISRIAQGNSQSEHSQRRSR